MIDVALSFGSTFVAVFALGFQSQNVNQGHYFWAAVTSVAIGLSSIALYKVMPQATSWQMLAYLVGGISGITASMWTHRRFLGEPKPRRVDEHADVGQCGLIHRRGPPGPIPTPKPRPK